MILERICGSQYGVGHWKTKLSWGEAAGGRECTAHIREVVCGGAQLNVLWETYERTQRRESNVCKATLQLYWSSKNFSVEERTFNNGWIGRSVKLLPPKQWRILVKLKKNFSILENKQSYNNVRSIYTFKKVDEFKVRKAGIFGVLTWVYMKSLTDHYTIKA